MTLRTAATQTDCGGCNVKDRNKNNTETRAQLLEKAASLIQKSSDAQIMEALRAAIRAETKSK